MTGRQEGTRYRVRLSVPRRGGWREWGPVSGSFERRLAGQESSAVIAADAETAQLVVAAVQAALQVGAPSRPARRRPRVPATGSEPLF
jgi:hypothetical protein